MTVVTIEIESETGYALLCAPNGDFGEEGMELDQSPSGLYSTSFTTRTASGAFQVGGRVTGQTVPIREMVLPINCYDMGQGIEKTISNLRRLFGSPLHRRIVTWRYTSELSGPRTLQIQLASEIKFSPTRDWNLDGYARAVVTVLATQPMYESPEEVQTWTNPGNFSLFLAATSGTYKLGYAGQLTAPIAYDADAATIQAALEALSTIGPGNVTVTGSGGKFTILTPPTCPGMLTVDGTTLTPIAFSITLGTLNYTLTYGGQTTAPIGFLSSAATIKQALEQLSNIGTGGVTVTATLFGFTLSFGTGSIIALLTGNSTAGFHVAYVSTNPNTGYFTLSNPTDQAAWPEWDFDPGQWQFPDFAFDQEWLWMRSEGVDADRMISTPNLTQRLSVMCDPMQDPYVNANLSAIAGNFNGVLPMYSVPPYTDDVIAPVVCTGPAGAECILTQRRFWSAESGLEA